MADDVLGGFLCRWELQCGGLDAAPRGLFQGKCVIQRMRGPGLAHTCILSPVVAHPGGYLTPTAHSSTESREQPGQAWRNEDLVFWDEGWREEGTQER